MNLHGEWSRRVARVTPVLLAVCLLVSQPVRAQQATKLDPEVLKRTGNYYADDR